jgi:heat shock protein HslJ
MKLISIILLAALLVSCNGTESAANNSSTDTGASHVPSTSGADTNTLAGTWYLIPVLPSDTGARKTPTLSFDMAGKTFSGHTGCNSMNGRFEYTDSTLSFDEKIMMTKMACIGYNEQVFIENLLRTESFRFQDSTLILMSGETELSRWSRTPVKPSVVKET